MIGFRGAARYISEDFRDCFALECEAIKRVRNTICLLYTSPSPRDGLLSRMPSSA